MKILKFFATLALTAAALISCTKEPAAPAQISTDKGTYEIGAAGGSITVKLIANEAWTATITPASSLDEVSDITVSPAEGPASDQPVEIKINVPANKGFDRKALLTINGGVLSAAATVAQAGEQGERLLTCTVAEFLDKPVDASVYYLLTGVITSIANTTYSNFNIKDVNGDAEVYIYGLGYKEDPSAQSVGLLVKEGIQEGDIITIASTRGVFGTTIEGMNSYYISHKKSENPTIKLDKTAYEALAAGETFDLAVTSNMVTWTLSSDVDWLHFDTASAAESKTVKVTVDAGVGGTGTITLSADGLESVKCTVTRAETVIITCAEFNNLPTDNSDTRTFEISGIISGITETDAYGNVTITDATGSIVTYGLLKEKGGASKVFQQTLAELGFKNGDYITVQCNHSYYAAKTVHQANPCWYVSHVSSKTIAEAIAAQGSDVVVSGTVVAPCAKGYILADANSAILIYTNAATDFVVGDQVTAVGKSAVYNFGPQLGSPKSIKTGHADYALPVPAELNAAACEAEIAATEGKDKSKDAVVNVRYATLTGTLVKSGNYYNIIIDGTDKAQGSLYQPGAEFTGKYADLTDKKVTLTGWYQSISGGKYIYLVANTLTDAAAGAKTFSVSDKELSAEADATTAKFTVKGNVDWTVTAPAGVTANPASGSGEKEVTLTFAANTGTAAVTYAVKVATADADVVTKEFTVTVNQKAGAAPEPISVRQAIAQIGADVLVEGTVAATCAKGYILADGTGAILIYTNAATDFVIGDQVRVSGKSAVYNFGPQIGSPVSTKLGHVDYALPVPEAMNAAACEAEIAATAGKNKTADPVVSIRYATLTGTLVKSGTYYNIIIDGTEAAQGSLYQPGSEFTSLYEGLTDKKVTLTGWYQSISGGKYIYLVATKLEEAKGDEPAAGKTGSIEDYTSEDQSSYLK